MNILKKSCDDNRSWDRFKLFLKAKYSCEQFSRKKECTVLDISENGACLKLQKDANIAEGDPIFFEVLNREMKKIPIECRVIWSQHTGESVLVGSRFTEKLDTEVFEKLD
jgi:hypothetical protein